MTHGPLRDRLVASPCCLPDAPLDELMPLYARLGFRCWEVFTSWAKAAFDVHGDPNDYLLLRFRHGFAYTSLHLPPIDDNLAQSLERALAGVELAAALGVEVVLYKATSRANYIRGAGPILDACAARGLVPVLQHHAGSPLTTLDDMAEVLDGVADTRLKTLLEVGHLHTAGIGWREGLAFLTAARGVYPGGIERVALVHIKDQRGPVSVPYGTGDIDLHALLATLNDAGYHGRIVVEMEVEDRENTPRYLADALQWLGA